MQSSGEAQVCVAKPIGTFSADSGEAYRKVLGVPSTQFSSLPRWMHARLPVPDIVFPWPSEKLAMPDPLLLRLLVRHVPFVEHDSFGYSVEAVPERRAGPGSSDVGHIHLGALFLTFLLPSASWWKIVLGQKEFCVVLVKALLCAAKSPTASFCVESER